MEGGSKWTLVLFPFASPHLTLPRARMGHDGCGEANMTAALFTPKNARSLQFDKLPPRLHRRYVLMRHQLSLFRAPPPSASR